MTIKQGMRSTGKKIAKRLGLTKYLKRIPFNTSIKSHPRPNQLRLSMVVATYNVDAYIDRFLASIFSQSSLLKSFEVIIVDDGSTDRSAEIVKEWQARYPKHLRYVYQENAGAAAARNTGLALARGTWVSFPDPDDFLDVDFIRKMLKETEHSQDKPLLAVFSNLLFYFEEQDEIVDSHPLKYRFKKAVTRKLSDDLEEFMHLSGATAWLHRETILECGLEFDCKVVPAFEDAHFINRVLLYAPDKTVSFVSDAKYYYRKRIEKNSALDRAKNNNGWFIDQLKYGSLDLILEAKKLRGFVPRHIQRTCFYDLFWKFKYLAGNSQRADFLKEDEKREFLNLTSEILNNIDYEVLESFSLAGYTEEHKVAILAIYKNRRRDSTAVYVEQTDASAGLVQFSYFTGGEDKFQPNTKINGNNAVPLLPSRRRKEFMGQTYFRQHFFWVPLEDGDDISFEIDGQPCRIRRGGKPLGQYADWLSLRNALSLSAPNYFDDEINSLRDFVLEMREKYRDCYVLMDRDDRADDNAEHLYRHMMATGRADNAWFILSRESSDWDRLEVEGFKLLPYGSSEHIAAQMNAAVLISSHADQYILWPVLQKAFADLAKYQFVFLQHGVTTNDLSDWLNSKPIRLFITAMPSEAADIAQLSGNYRFTERETLLSGFPRHDRLLEKMDECQPDSILIMPTWRKYLTVEDQIPGERRRKIEGFSECDFAKNWSAVLNSPALREIAHTQGLRVVLTPHPNAAMYMEDMRLPDWVETVDVRRGVFYQDLLARALVAVTDFSSAVTEVAYLQRPVIYFQFDPEEIFKGDHVYKKGYFSFERDGFGPVVAGPDDVIVCLREAVSGREDPVYAERRRAAFPYRDGGCCERVSTAIERLFDRRPGLSPLHATQKVRSNCRQAL